MIKRTNSASKNIIWNSLYLELIYGGKMQDLFLTYGLNLALFQQSME